jgi:spermidine synthase
LLIGVTMATQEITLHSTDNHPRADSTFASAEVEKWDLPRLLLASFLTLFAELALIRWLAVEVRIFAYIKNLALLLCFLGFGFGCSLARRRMQWANAVSSILVLLVVIRVPWPGKNQALGNLSTALGSAGDVELWSHLSWNWHAFLPAALLAAVLFVLLLATFIPLGQIVSRQMDLSPRPLSAYSWNLAASLLGILAFIAASRLMLPPAAWFAVVVGGIALLQPRPRLRWAVLALILPVALLLHDKQGKDRFTRWTPYQQIGVERLRFPNGEWLGENIRVNHVGYQVIVNLAPDFLRRHPGLVKETLEENPYNLPFRFTSSAPRVLIVGAGTGNDAAAALRHGSSHVDAVEIDPAIYALGRQEHPEHPYDSPAVSVYVEDARNFLKRTDKTYDLILFGLLDSHTTVDYSNMRIDNFVYTEEAFREARRHLNPDGILFVKFEVRRRWLGRRLAELLNTTFGKQPTVFFANSSYTVSATCFAVSPTDRVEKAISGDAGLAKLVGSGTLEGAFASDQRLVKIHDPGPDVRNAAVETTTDDWPYLYHQGRWIPRTYYSISILVLLIALVLYFRVPETRNHRPSLFFFAMGAGFLLLETQAVSRLSLFFGTTWQVSGIVIGALLTALLLANAVVDRWWHNLSEQWLVAGLLGGLLLAYSVPFHRIPWAPTWVGMVAAIVFSVPVFFAGMLFAVAFRTCASRSAALGANMLGAVMGGLMENISLVVGMRALLVVAFCFYCVAAWAVLRARSRVPALMKAVRIGA